MNDVAQITLRAAATDDAERLATLLTDEGYPAGPSDLAARIERFSTPDARVIVAEAGGEVVGFVAFNVVPRFEIDERFIRIIALVVDPLERERGRRPTGCSPRSSGSRATRASRSSRSRPGTTGPRPASCSSRSATTPA